VTSPAQINSVRLAANLTENTPLLAVESFGWRALDLLAAISFSGTKTASVDGAMAKARFEQPWWLGSGTEICPICHHLYLYETEYRCADCDGPVCSDCVKVRESVTVVCTPCFDCADSSEE
jgi:hypothetical protein